MKKKLLMSLLLLAIAGALYAQSGNASLNGTWRDNQGNSFTMNNGSFEHSVNNQSVMRGTYTTSGRNMAMAISMAVREIHGGYLRNIQEGPTYANKWYTRNNVDEAFRNWMKSAYPTLDDGTISQIVDETLAGDIDAMFPTLAGNYTLNGNNLTMTLNGYTYNLAKR